MTTTNGQLAPRARGARWWVWPCILTGLLGGQMTLMLFMVMVATHDRSFAVVPDYYEKALHWDDQAAIARAERALGWKASASLGEAGGPLRMRTLRVELKDALGRPLEGGELTVEMFHPVAPDERITATLAATAPGVYAAEAPAHRAGLWDVHVTVRRGPDVFELRQQVEAPASMEGGRR